MDDALPFISGLELNRAYYEEAVRRILAEYASDLTYSAALIGYGSDVLGYDTAISTDHEWGPRLLLFLDEPTYAARADEISQRLSVKLPTDFRGYSTGFSARDAEGVCLMEPATPGVVRHHIDFHTIRGFFAQELGVDPDTRLNAVGWLLIPQQRLLGVTSGAVFHDGLQALVPLREKLVFYPRDVWLYLLAAQWTRISQEEAFVGRCGDLGDDLGSQVIAARLVRDLMRLCFLMERRYFPYSKWLGTAFSRLDCGPRLQPILFDALSASDWHERERSLSAAYEIVAAMHNALDLTPPLDTAVSPYYGRPYLTLYARRFAEALVMAINDPAMRGIIERVGLIGGIDQVADSVDLLTDTNLCTRLRAIYAG
ncbi:MAG TPA: DUF4037 domain-containing protein [Ktedonobacterales bacterium]|jgi:hypothetical protein